MYKEVKEVKDRSGSCPLLPEPPLRPSPPESRESILDFRAALRHNFASGLRGPRGPTSRFLLHGGFLMRLLVAALVAALALLPTCDRSTKIPSLFASRISFLPSSLRPPSFGSPHPSPNGPLF